MPLVPRQLKATLTTGGRRLRRFWRESRGWNIRYGELWMVQWQLNWWASLGIHLDVKRRTVTSGRFEGQTYGPYVDFHLIFVIVSLGWHPFLSGALLNESGIARGGESVPTDEDMIVERITWSFTRFVEILMIALLVLTLLRPLIQFPRWYPLGKPTLAQPNYIMDCRLLSPGHMVCNPDR